MSAPEPVLSAEGHYVLSEDVCHCPKHGRSCRYWIERCVVLQEHLAAAPPTPDAGYAAGVAVEWGVEWDGHKVALDGDVPMTQKSAEKAVAEALDDFGVEARVISRTVTPWVPAALDALTTEGAR